jgi:heterotetrameric sarcosine oxidase gamma subunit
MERLALAAGARTRRVEGWNVPNAYELPTVEWDRLTRTVGFADRSSLTKLELQAEPSALSRVLARASAHGAEQGVALAPRLATRSGSEEEPDTWWCPLTPSRVLVLAEPTAGAGLREALRRAVAEEPATTSVVDVTCALAALALVGPRCRELLARFCAIDVRPALALPGSFRPGSIARTPGYVLVESPERLLVLIGWALGEYLWQVVADAAANLDGGPVGAEALAHRREAIDA